MKKYRIKIEEIEGTKYTHKKNIMFKTNDIKKVISNILLSVEKEHNVWKKEFIEYLIEKKLGTIERWINEIDSDLIDWNSKGKDITKKGFIENEIFFECHDN